MPRYTPPMAAARAVALRYRPSRLPVPHRPTRPATDPQEATHSTRDAITRLIDNLLLFLTGVAIGIGLTGVVLWHLS